jgi:hypothetical protein
VCQGQYLNEVMNGILGDQNCRGRYRGTLSVRTAYRTAGAAARHLPRQLSDKFKLRDGADPQVYGIGIKELACCIICWRQLQNSFC